MVKKILFICILALGSFLSEKSLAQSPSSLPVSFSSVIFANYSYAVEGTDGKDANKFDLERMYFTLKSQFADDWKLQFTTDLYRNSAAGSYYSGLTARIKFGFIDYTPWSSLSIKAGIIPGPWHSVVEALWKYRGVATTASDKYGYVPTADLGVSATYSLPGKYGEIAAHLTNGEGYSSPESNKFKDFVLRTTLVPFPASQDLKSLSFSAYAYLGKTGAGDGLKKQRYGAAAGYAYSFLSVGGEYDSKTDGVANAADVNANVLSVFGEIKMPTAELMSKLSLILRYDISEPNQDKPDDKTKLFIAGLSWKATEKVTLVLDHQVVNTETAILKQADGTFIDSDKRWFVHMIVTL